MFFEQAAHYIPQKKVSNDYFEKKLGLDPNWIVERTGMVERRRAGADENTNTMAVAAVENLKSKADLHDVDLIVAGSYTFYDTIVTPAHAVQKYLGIEAIPVLGLTSACSSFLNAAEVVEGYFTMGKSKKALLILSEQNSLYHNEEDQKSGHLWGDGAVAFLISRNQPKGLSLKVEEVKTAGAANVGKGTEGVMLKPAHGGIDMPHGRDVFINACQYMAKTTVEILTNNGLSMDDLTYLVPHQANNRISQNVAASLQLEESRILSNVQYLGNTGSAGSGIALSESWSKYKKGDNLVVSVFGGGYSYGAMLLKAVQD